MATKKAPAKKVTTKKTAAKPVAKKTVAKATKRVEKKSPAAAPANIYNTNVSVLLAMAIEALILLLGYLIIMNAA